MVSMKVIKATNEVFRASQHSKGLVGLFVGATSGIGEYTLKTFARYSQSPRIYFVGRSQPDAERIIQETTTINPSASVTFIKADLTSIANVDKVSEQFKEKEDKLHVLCMSQGYLTMANRTEGPEGLDKKLTINYYSRMRFINNLLPTLKRTVSSSETPFTPQVLSILAPGRESSDILRNLISKDDLSLKSPANYGLRSAEAMTCTSNSLSLEELAIQNPELNFGHVSPGVVMTKITRELPIWVKGLSILFRPLMWAFGDKVEDVGEGMLYLMTRTQQEVTQADIEGKIKQAGNLYLGYWNGDDKGDWRKRRDWEAERKGLREEVVRLVSETFKEVDAKIEQNATNAA